MMLASFAINGEPCIYFLLGLVFAVLAHVTHVDSTPS